MKKCILIAVLFMCLLFNSCGFSDDQIQQAESNTHTKDPIIKFDKFQLNDSEDYSKYVFLLETHNLQYYGGEDTLVANEEEFDSALKSVLEGESSAVTLFVYFSSDYFNESVLSKFDYWSYSEHSGFVVVDMMKSGIDSNALKELSKYKQITQIKISEPPGVPIDEME